MALLRYISHPNVEVDPAVPVPEWGLSELGRDRAVALSRQTWLASVGRVVSSGERKAVETASLIADRANVDVEIRPASGEIDRSATGFVPPALHDELADQCFASPTDSARGWETAAAAQQRVLAALSDLLETPPGAASAADRSEIVVVGHGGVGTLLLCHLAGLAIDRRHDQPGQGHSWTFDSATRTMLHRWLPIEELSRGRSD